MLTVISIIFLIIIVSCLGYWQSGKMLYQGTRTVLANPNEMGWEYEEVALNVGQHQTICWFIPAETLTHRTILFSHGNAGNLGDKLKSLALFRDLGYNVCSYDYGGYGHSTGTTTEARCYDDIRAVWTHLREIHHISASQIVLHGRSLGAGPTVQLATEVEAGAVVIESAFLSIPKVIRSQGRWVPGWIFGRNRFDNESKVGDLRSPVLFVHGEADSVIPYEHGKRLFELASEPKEFLDIEGEHHEGFWKSGATYTDGLIQFFDKHLGAN